MGKLGFTKKPKGWSKKPKPLVTGCRKKASEEAKQEDTSCIQTAGTLPPAKPGFTKKIVQFQQKNNNKTSMLHVLVFTDTHITGLKDAEQATKDDEDADQATKDDEDAKGLSIDEIDAMPLDQWVEKCMAEHPESCE